MRLKIVNIEVSESKFEKLEKTVDEMNKNLNRLIMLLDGDTNLKNGLASMVSDHETRIENLEKWQIRVVTIYAVIAFLFSFLSPIIYNWITK